MRARSDLRVATLEEVLEFGSRGGHKALRARGLLPPIGGGAGWSLIQGTSANVTNAGTIGASVPFTSNVVVDHVLIAAANFSANAVVTWTFSDTQGNQWFPLGTFVSSTEVVTQAIYYAIAGSSAADKPKWTNNSATSTNCEIYIGEFAIPAGTISQDGVATSSQSTAANVLLPAGGGTDSNDLLINLLSFGTAWTSWAGGWADVGASRNGDACGYKANAAGNSTPNANQTSSSTYASLVVALKATLTSAAPVFPVFLPRNTLGRGVRNRGQIARFLERIPKVAAVGPAVMAVSTSDTSLTTTSFSWVMVTARSTADTSLSSDAVTPTSARSRATADTSLSADAASTATKHPCSTADASVSTDSMLRTMADLRSTADTSLSTDAVSPAKGYARSTADTSNSSDVTSRGALILSRSSSDTSASADSVTCVRLLLSSTADTSLSSDSVTPAKGYARGSADTSLSSDTASRGALILARSTADTSASSDVLTRAILFTRTIGGSYPSIVLADHPDGYWRLDDLSGTVATDSSGNGLNGVYHTGFTLAQPGALAGDTDTAVSFTGGTNAQVDGIAASSLALSAGSVEAWVKTTSSGAVKGIATKFLAYGMYVNASGRLDSFDWTASVFVNSGTGTGNGTAGPVINDGQWHHVAMTFQSGVALALYVDGAAVAGLAHPQITVSSQANDFQIASGHFAGQNLPGTVDEVAVYPSVLSAAQIANRYSTGKYGADISLSSDTLTIVKGVARSTTDTSVSSDTLTRTLYLARSTADTSLSSDVMTPTTPGRFFSSTADTSLSSDTLTRSTRLGCATADTSLSSDAVSPMKGYARSSADTSLSSDAVSRGLILTRFTADTSLSADTLTRSTRLVRTTADSSLSSDTMSAVKGVGRTSADTSLSSDAVSRVLFFPRATADSSLSSDTATTISRFPRSTADTSASSDVFTRQFGRARFTADTSASSDALTRTIRFPRSTADTSASSDALTTASRISRSSSDTSLSSDVFSRAIQHPRATSDTSLSSDATSRGGLHYQRSSADISLSVDRVFTGFGIPTAVCLPTVSTLSSPYYGTAAKLAGYATNATVAGYAAVGGGIGGLCGGTIYTIGGVLIGGALGSADLPGGLPTNSTIVGYQTMSTLLPYEAAEKIPSCVA